MLQDIKKKLMQSALDSRRKKHPFDAEASELYSIRPTDPHEINNSYFLGAHTMEGDDLTIRLGQRNGDEHELFLIYRTADGRVLYMEHDHYTAEDMPMHVVCEEVAQRWRYSFDGYLRDADGRRYRVAFDTLFTAKLPIYDFMYYPEQHDGMTLAMARERWTPAFFKALGESSQQHYEQLGHLCGQITVDGEARTIDWPAVRDRANGRRIWEYMNCHLWISVTTEHGDCLMMSLVSYPVMKSVFTGYHNIGGKQHYATLTGYRLLEYDHCGGHGPQHFACYTEWSDGSAYLITADKDSDVLCTFDHGDYFWHECLGNVRINGIQARGNLEYAFNKDPERWGRYLSEQNIREAGI